MGFRDITNYNLEYGAIVDNYEGSAGKVFTSTAPYKSISISNDGGSDITLTPAGDNIDYSGSAITIMGCETFTDGIRGRATTFTIVNSGGSAIRAIVRR